MRTKTKPATLFGVLAVASAALSRDPPAIRGTQLTRYAQATDGICSKYPTDGWHEGTYVESLPANTAPNGVSWTWEQCAKECALRPDSCEFWTLQLTGNQACLMMADQGSYSDTGNHVEGDFDSDCASISPDPEEPDGGCSKFDTTGWHKGKYEKAYTRDASPNGIEWSWQQCAKECALFDRCTFWTLQLTGDKRCFLMSAMGDYVDTVNHVEGTKDLDCAQISSNAPTTSPSRNPTYNPTPHPTANPTPHPTANPTPHPTANPTPHPTANPTPHPTANPTPHPTANPTPHPTANPTPHPTSNPTPHPTSNPTTSPSSSEADGVCSKYTTDGWHDGTYVELLPANTAPNGVSWTWEQCAKECALRPGSCEFWTLQLTGNKACLMMADQGSYSDTGNHVEGDFDSDCASISLIPGGWYSVWSDEFNGADGDPIDASVWGYEEGYVRNDEAQYYSTRLENSRIDGNALLIEAHRDFWNGREYTSASRTTKGKKSFLFGRFAMRAKIDVRDGSWPAWWWLPVSGGWPIGGEIDMMEYYQRKLLFNVMDGNKQWSSVKSNIDSNHNGDDFSNYWHVWTFDWSADEITLYLDGVLMNSYNVADADGTGPNGENPFRREAYLLINQAIGGAAGGDPANTDFPVKYRVDWVRQWEWDPLANDVVDVIVTNGSGSGRYKIGTLATVACGQPPLGMVFSSWTVNGGAISSDQVLDDPDSEHTTLVVPSGGVTLVANYVQGSPPTESPVAAPTPQTDGVCSKFDTTGWHEGKYEKTFTRDASPNGIEWSWQQCAKECALFDRCTFWTLQLTGDKRCFLMSAMGDYVDAVNHTGGIKDLDCDGLFS